MTHEDPRRTAYVVKLEREVERLRGETYCAKAKVCERLAQVLHLELPSNYDPVDAIAFDIGRLLDEERRWNRACEIARSCCPVRDGESYIMDGIPRLADAHKDAMRERDEARAECSKLHEQLREGCTCGSGGHPRHCKRHPGAYESHVELLNTETALDEARAKVDDLKAELQLTQMKLRIARERNSADMAKSHVETFERTKERDEARAECTRLRKVLETVADGNGIHVGMDETGLFCAACGKRGLGNDHFDSCPVAVARAALAFDATKKKGE